jgi:hypothetical protein
VRNTRERLHHLYGTGRQQFALSPAAGGGTVASVVIPFDIDDGPPAAFTAPPFTPSTPDHANDGVSPSPSPATVVGPAAFRRRAS